MASGKLYESPTRGSEHTWDFYKSRKNNPNWVDDYQLVKREHFWYQIFSLLVFFDSMEFLAILLIAFPRIMNNQQVFIPGCFLDRFVQFLRKIFFM
ncbi:conserved protein of unknown function [Oenococcus oeni]|uniref:hypothetical protein n=1 Tax=Oenococcus oeni TaxID=1247 RepID=UPI00107C633F|nr:hypothetical protein [Oenococcus oeni]AVI94652.1 hypothetical protein AX764_07440 [Oenococcus oeni]SYV98967.1 conserved hypothetical protein [Oenococcus oeni]SYV99333.1 conserved hypothetical protein [Oenococcus oeni]SYW18159.1 conserved hypothetical protein [Oenococcus oeni]VDC15250.1 conserved protein of unknown function [Oenococcus oeni]